MGRFTERPHYKISEIEHEAESLVFDYFKNIQKIAAYPLSTDDLTNLIEKQVDSLDLYADLNEYGMDVEGVTEFSASQPPRVKISRELSENSRLENRLRATLAHELGHVHLHRHLFQMSQSQTLLFGDSNKTTDRVICKRDGISTTESNNWMEWQAWTFSGALLAPSSQVVPRLRAIRDQKNLVNTLVAHTANGEMVVHEIANKFIISADFARVWLQRLDLLKYSSSSSSVF